MSRIPLTKTVSNTIVKARAAMGWSQCDLAQKSGTVRSMIKRIEKHEISTVDAKVLEKIQKSLSTTSKSAMSTTSRKPKTKAIHAIHFANGSLEIVNPLPKRKDLGSLEFYKVKVSGNIFIVDALLGSEIIAENQFGGNKSGRLNIIEDDRPTLNEGDEATIGIWFP